MVWALATFPGSGNHCRLQSYACLRYQAIVLPDAAAVLGFCIGGGGRDMPFAHGESGSASPAWGLETLPPVESSRGKVPGQGAEPPRFESDEISANENTFCIETLDKFGEIR